MLIINEFEITPLLELVMILLSIGMVETKDQKWDLCVTKTLILIRKRRATANAFIILVVFILHDNCKKETLLQLNLLN